MSYWFKYLIKIIECWTFALIFIHWLMRLIVDSLLFAYPVFINLSLIMLKGSKCHNFVGSFLLNLNQTLSKLILHLSQPIHHPYPTKNTKLGLVWSCFNFALSLKLKSACPYPSYFFKKVCITLGKFYQSSIVDIKYSYQKLNVVMLNS